MGLCLLGRYDMREREENSKACFKLFLFLLVYKGTRWTIVVVKNMPKDKTWQKIKEHVLIFNTASKILKHDYPSTLADTHSCICFHWRETNSEEEFSKNQNESESEMNNKIFSTGEMRATNQSRFREWRTQFRD
jgi:hypothetical protein